jgi:hypothetical protein
VPRTSSIGLAASATSAPNRRAVGSGRSPRVSHGRSAASSSAAGDRSGVGAAEPIPVPTVRAAGSSATDTEQTAITIALRVPTFANCCGPGAGGTSTAEISSSSARTLRFGPVKNRSIGTRRVPRTDASSTTAPAASSGGWASPAGDADPRFPPTVPRLRICGEPTVRDAWARPGSRAPSSSMMRV